MKEEENHTIRYYYFEVHIGKKKTFWELFIIVEKFQGYRERLIEL